jgi:hypothetical protein
MDGMFFLMRSSLSVLVLLALLPVRNDAAQLRTNFVADAVLSATDLDAVEKLAVQCGMKNVAEVRTFHYRPIGGRGIVAVSVEEVNGRVVTYKTLNIERDGWAFHTSASASQQIPRVDSFWVQPPVSLVSHKEVTFAVGTDTLRVAMLDEIPLATADKIVNAFAAGRIRFKDDNVKRQVEPRTFVPPDGSLKPDYSHPTWIGTEWEGSNLVRQSRQNHFWITFSGRMDRYEFELDGQEVRILDVVFVVI